MNQKKKTIMFPHPPGSGGPGSFQTRFEEELKSKDYEVAYKGSKVKPDLILVVGGTKKLFWLAKMRLSGIPVFYRLDGIGWLHKKRKTSLKYYFTAELRNALSKCIHGFLASKIIYQSQFVKDWWKRSGWRKRSNSVIIHNGVNIPDKEIIIKARENNKDKRLVILEGVIDYTPYAINLLNELAEKLPNDIQIELYGKFEHHNPEEVLNPRLLYKGFLSREQVPEVFAGSVYLSLDIHPACPNTVPEALACAAPVVAYNTGALPELIDDQCGKIVEYGSNPWKLGYPNTKDMVRAILDVFENYKSYSENAYNKASLDYQLKDMFKKYLSVFNDVT
jgi:glycosyltransferase involved in cell wall biosynthesis